MGKIFDKETGDIYDSWYQSAHGRAADRCITKLVTTLLEPLHGERVLDVGCGSGNHLLTFSRLGLAGSGLDPSSEMLARARKRLGAGCCLKRGEVEDLPFEDNEFHLVTFIHTLEFVEDPLEALREAGRVASRKVLVVTINSLSCSGIWKRIRSLSGDPLFGPARQFSILSLKNLATRAYGDVPTDWRSIHRPSRIQRPLPKTGEAGYSVTKNPFGHTVGLACTMKYVIKTDNMPIKNKLKEPCLRLVRPTTAEPANQNFGGSPNERSMSL